MTVHLLTNRPRQKLNKTSAFGRSLSSTCIFVAMIQTKYHRKVRTFAIRYSKEYMSFLRCCMKVALEKEKEMMTVFTIISDTIWQCEGNENIHFMTCVIIFPRNV